jgi:hypothetical protein
MNEEQEQAQQPSYGANVAIVAAAGFATSLLSSFVYDRFIKGAGTVTNEDLKLTLDTKFAAVSDSLSGLKTSVDVINTNTTPAAA